MVCPPQGRAGGGPRPPRVVVPRPARPRQYSRAPRPARTHLAVIRQLLKTCECEWLGDIVANCCLCFYQLFALWSVTSPDILGKCLFIYLITNSWLLSTSICHIMIRCPFAKRKHKCIDFYLAYLRSSTVIRVWRSFIYKTGWEHYIYYTILNSVTKSVCIAGSTSTLFVI